MPDDWFRYRNYYTKTVNNGDEADEDPQISQPPVTVGDHTMHLGGGTLVKFTGTLATARFLALWDYKNIRAPETGSVVEVEDDQRQIVARNPDAPVTQQQAKQLGQSFQDSNHVVESGEQVPSFLRSSLRVGVEPARGTKKKRHATKRAEKLNRREADENAASNLPREDSPVNPVEVSPSNPSSIVNPIDAQEGPVNPGDETV
ncbi:MAG: hypothetical protein LQ350_008545 [Teloschistes chrysophthalmus]|nr:MAG: hypothetical protein LQ350_008545 [Niorma chrysophthalma]